VELHPPLVTDFDRSVRAKAHTAHVAVWLAARKRFVPYLKQCLGPWVVSLYDSDRQVAKTAIECFNAAFETDAKKKSVWGNLSEDIRLYILNILRNENARSISIRPLLRGVLMT